MMSLHTLPHRFSRVMGALLERKLLDSADIVVRWNAATAPVDPNLEATYSAKDQRSETIRGFVHFVSARAIQRGFTEFQVGDAIVTFEPTVDLNRKGLVFVLNDVEYVQASVGERVAEFWDVMIGGEPMTTTLVLRKKT